MPISPLDIPGVPGVLYLMACPGRVHPVVGRPPMRSRIARDLRELQRLGVVGVITLLEGTELQTLGVSELPQVAHELRLWWLHLPVADRQAPGPPFEEAWAMEGGWVRDGLTQGARVMIHCHAGLGRTGTFAARLLVELGLSPEAAIERVRAVRPGAIETPWQEDYVRRFPTLRPPFPGGGRLR